MARTLNEIYNDLVANVNSDPTLSTLLPNPDNYDSLFTIVNFRLLANTVVNNLSVSKVAIWRLICFICAFGLWTVENLIDIFKTEVDEVISLNQYGQLRWYPTVAKLFQLGDSLVFQDNGSGMTRFIYDPVDVTKQIVTQAAATHSNSVITLKIAKGVLPNITPLSQTELKAFIFYMKGTNSATADDGIIPAGTNLVIVSDDSDDLKFAIDLFYDPLILSSTGESLATPGTFPVNDAINNFINTLPFDSIFKIRGLEDAIQAVNGINNLVVKNCDARESGGAAFTDITAVQGQVYTSFSGYMRMNTNNGLDGYYNYPTDTIKTLNFIED